MSETISVPNHSLAKVTITIDDDRDSHITAFGQATLKDRYLLKGETIQKMFARVAGYYADGQDHAQRLYDYMSQLWFMPATPILSNGGTDRSFPISCFLNKVGDSLKEINEIYTENLWLAAKGGGIGSDWSDVREIGHKVRENGKTSGIMPFLHIMDSMTLGISQGSLRRGSAATYLSMSHPEIEEFIEMRRPTGGDPNRKNLNLHHGVSVSDKFMEAVDNNKPWQLVSPKDGRVVKEVSAREMWQRLLTARLETGEPYILFIDQVNRQRPEIQKRLGMKITQSNLCVEITLPTGVDYLGNMRTAVCCLSSLNLEKHDEWKDSTGEIVADVMRFLDNVLQDFINRTAGVTGFENARYSAHQERSIGIGVMGFHSYLQKKGIPFESVMAKVFNKRVWRELRDHADIVNIQLAKEKGSCPDAEAADFKMRFSNVFAVAPTASISTICGEASPGIDPYSANSFVQKTLSGSFNVRNKHLDELLNKKFFTIEDDVTFSKWKEHIWSSITVKGGSVQHLNFLNLMEKETFKTAFEMDQMWVIEHAADRAEFIHQSQSVNVFIRPDTHKKILHNIHWQAWKKGVKSLYYCRSLSIRRAQIVSNNLSGEMPQPRHTRELELVEIEDFEPEECLACS